MGPIRCPETSVNNYHTTPCNILEERRSHKHRGGSQKSKPEVDVPKYTLAYLAVNLISHICVAGVADKTKEAVSETKMEVHVFEARPSSAALLTLLVSIDRLATFAFQT
jgi:hypothetical protein